MRVRVIARPDILRFARSGITSPRLRGVMRKLIFVAMGAVVLSSWVMPTTRADEAPVVRHNKVRQFCTGSACCPYAGLPEGS
jgi:hypothetical protein